MEVAGVGRYRIDVVDTTTGRSEVALSTDGTSLPVRLPPAGEWLMQLRVNSVDGSRLVDEVRFRTAPASAPSITHPLPEASVIEGDVDLHWTEVTGATGYEYYVTQPGRRRTAVRGFTKFTAHRVMLAARRGSPTTYHAIARACFSANGCNTGVGWGPWSSEVHLGPAEFTVLPAAASADRPR
jgi:hypothetical protein